MAGLMLYSDLYQTIFFMKKTRVIINQALSTNKIASHGYFLRLLLKQRHGVLGNHELLVGRYYTYRNL